MQEQRHPAQIVVKYKIVEGSEGGGTRVVVIRWPLLVTNASLDFVSVLQLGSRCNHVPHLTIQLARILALAPASADDAFAPAAARHEVRKRMLLLAQGHRLRSYRQGTSPCLGANVPWVQRGYPGTLVQS